MRARRVDKSGDHGVFGYSARDAALEFDGRTYTFGEIDARSNRMAQYLLGRDLKTGDRLALQLPNCVEMIDLYLACVKLGVIFVPVNVLYKEREIGHILNDAEPALFLTEPPDASAFSAERPVVALDGDTPAGISSLPLAQRLALEMAAHDEVERRALEGELAALEDAWKEAEEVAAISDELTLPQRVLAQLERLKG